MNIEDREPLIWGGNPTIPAWPYYSYELRYTLPDGKKDAAMPRAAMRSIWMAIEKGTEVAEKRIQEGCTDLELSIYCKGVMPFFQEWFCHATIDDGRDDATILRHFQEYVYWVQSLNDRQPLDESGYRLDRLCLMGAEDQWRWRGAGQDKEPPCRCKYCAEAGIVRINH